MATFYMNKPTYQQTGYAKKTFSWQRMGLLVATLCILTSCATLSKEECKLGNWQAIGYSDGVAGYYPSRISSHAKACAKVNVTPNIQAWEQGRQQGLKQYCTQMKAYQLGKVGQYMNAVCPSSQIETLQKANAHGLEYYRLNQVISEQKNKLNTYQDELKKLKNGEMLEFTEEKEARAYLLTLPEKIRTAKNTIEKAQQRLNDLQNKYGY